MAEDFIQLPIDSIGKKVRSFSNTVGPNTVHSQASTITDTQGAPMGDLVHGAVRVANAAAVDALGDGFGRMRTVEPTTEFGNQFQYDISDRFWIQELVSGGTITHLPNEASAQLTVPTASGASAILQTKNYMRYKPGSTLNILASCVFGVPKANVVKRVGYFDGTNGMFFEQTAAGMSIVRRTSVTGSPVNNTVAQADWNLDRMDGTGPSGITLDFTQIQVLAIDFAWLGAGTIRWGFLLDGRVIYCHAFMGSNALTTPTTTTVNLPVRYEITNTGVSASSTSIKGTCATVKVDGSFDSTEHIQASAGRGASLLGVTTRRPVFSIRLRTTFNGISFRGNVVPSTASIVATTSPCFVEMVLNGTLTGAAFANVDTAFSAVEADSAATAITGGVVLDTFYIAASGGGGGVAGQLNANFAQALTLGLSNFTGSTSDIISIVITGIGGTSNVGASLTWEEIR